MSFRVTSKLPSESYINIYIYRKSKVTISMLTGYMFNIIIRFSINYHTFENRPKL